ncbi:hypothetical protein ACFYRC_37665 [Streptomyces sp. NPDC005279]|uniref:hypothetical protein n=1 Tax=Streptomyces sp. NPDC005279 TaxID=3364712 RepID=UPI00368129DC
MISTQQWMLTSVLGITAAPAKRTPSRSWYWRAARRLGAWISQQRVKAAKLVPERVEELSVLGMRWS